MARLSNAGLVEGAEDEGRPDLKYILLLSGVLVPILLLFLVAGSVYVAAHVSTTTTSTSTSTTTTTSTTSTTSTSSTSTSTTTTSTESTSTTTSTIPCGDIFQQPCGNNTCSGGYVVGSRGVCQPFEYGKTVKSGMSGCGEQTLYWRGSTFSI